MIFGSSKTSPTKTCLITGTTSGLGKATVKALLKEGNHNIICAVRDVEKMKSIIEKENFDKSKLVVAELDLASFDSTRKFASKIKTYTKGKPLDKLVCNAAVYQPALSVVSLCTVLQFL
jgi:NAD(P)-dependent dehydrogenase (short-subunit alcohol dehydrogenase family)